MWLSLAAQIVGAALAYALSIALARSLGAAGFGAVATVLAWVSPLALVAGFGLPTTALRYLPAYRAQGDGARLAGFLRASERVALASSSAAAAVGSAIALAFADSPPPWLAGLWTLPLTVLLRFHTEAARAAGRYVEAFFVPLFQPLVTLAAVLVAARLPGGLSPALALALPALGTLIALPWLRSTTRHLASTCGPAGDGAPGSPDSAPPGAARPALPRAPVYETRAWLRVSIGVLVVDAAHLLLAHADVLLLGALRASRAVALFSAATATASFAMFPMIAVGAVTVPSFSRLWALGHKDELERLAQRAVLRAFTAQLAVAAAVTAVARPLLSLYGAGFGDAFGPLLFVLAGQLANTGTGYVGSLLNMTGHQGKVGRALWIAAALNITLVIALTSLWGVTGAAAGTALSALGYNTWLCHLVRRHLGARVSFVDAVLALRRERAAAGRSQGELSPLAIRGGAGPATG